MILCFTFFNLFSTKAVPTPRILIDHTHTCHTRGSPDRMGSRHDVSSYFHSIFNDFLIGRQEPITYRTQSLKFIPSAPRPLTRPASRHWPPSPRITKAEKDKKTR